MTNLQAQMRMARYESVEYAALRQEVTHPVEAYRDPEALARLWERIEDKRKHPSPSEFDLMEGRRWED